MHSACEEHQCNYTFSDLTDVPSETNSQAKGDSGFQVTGPSPLNIFSAEEFCTLAVLQESKTYAAEKLNVCQGCLVLYAYLVDIMWCAIKPHGDISILWLEFFFFWICVFHLKVWNAHYARRFVVNFTILSCLSLCGVIRMFLCRVSWRKLSLHDVFAACLLSSFAQKCADALARWLVTLGAVQKVMSVRCHTCQNHPKMR